MNKREDEYRWYRDAAGRLQDREKPEVVEPPPEGAP